MRHAPLLALLASLLAAVPAQASPRFGLLGSDGTGYALELDRSPDGPLRATLTDEEGGNTTSQVPVATADRPIRIGASARCLPGGTRLLRVYGTAASHLTKVKVHPSEAGSFRLRRVPVPPGWGYRGRVVAAVVETAGETFRVVAKDSRGRKRYSLEITFTTKCASDGAPALAASVTPQALNPDSADLTARLALPARSEAATYSVEIVQPGWDHRRGAFSGNPWGSPLGPDGDVTLDGPGAIEGASPETTQVGNVCLRGSAQISNTVTVRLGPGESTVLEWPLALALEPLLDRTRLAPGFRVTRDGFTGEIGGAAADYDGRIGVRFGMKARKRGERVTVRGKTFPAVKSRTLTVYILESRPRPEGAQLIDNDFRPHRTLQVRTNSRGRFKARFEADDRAYRVVPETRDPGPGLVADRGCGLTVDYR